jgi:hypothetical protein
VITGDLDLSSAVAEGRITVDGAIAQVETLFATSSS